MSKKPNPAEFLRLMQGSAPETEAPAPAAKTEAAAEAPAASTVHPLPQPRKAKGKAKPAKPSRAELKHFGGYLQDDTLEQIALLRARLKLDNSELIKLAIDDLFRKHTAKRAFGDA